MKIGDRIFVRGYIDEIRKDTVIIRNAGGYFGTIPSEVITGELPSAHPEIIRCRECRHWYTGDGYNHENGAQCALTHMWMSPDDYCSYGRRKVSE